jgi:hypothetical protein
MGEKFTARGMLFEPKQIKNCNFSKKKKKSKMP